MRPRFSIWGSVRPSVRRLVRPSIRPSVRPSVRRSVRRSVTPSLKRLRDASNAEHSALFRMISGYRICLSYMNAWAYDVLPANHTFGFYDLFYEKCYYSQIIVYPSTPTCGKAMRLSFIAYCLLHVPPKSSWIVNTLVVFCPMIDFTRSM